MNSRRNWKRPATRQPLLSGLNATLLRDERFVASFYSNFSLVLIYLEVWGGVAKVRTHGGSGQRSPVRGSLQQTNQAVGHLPCIASSDLTQFLQGSEKVGQQGMGRRNLVTQKEVH